MAPMTCRPRDDVMARAAARRSPRGARPVRQLPEPRSPRRLVRRDVHPARRARSAGVRPQAHVLGRGLDRPGHARPRNARGWFADRRCRPAPGPLAAPYLGAATDGDDRRDPHARPVRRAHRLGPDRADPVIDAPRSARVLDASRGSTRRPGRSRRARARPACRPGVPLPERLRCSARHPADRATPATATRSASVRRAAGTHSIGVASPAAANSIDRLAATLAADRSAGRAAADGLHGDLKLANVACSGRPGRAHRLADDRCARRSRSSSAGSLSPTAARCRLPPGRDRRRAYLVGPALVRGPLGRRRRRRTTSAEPRSATWTPARSHLDRRAAPARLAQGRWTPRPEPRCHQVSRPGMISRGGASARLRRPRRWLGRPPRLDQTGSNYARSRSAPCRRPYRPCQASSQQTAVQPGRGSQRLRVPRRAGRQRARRLPCRARRHRGGDPGRCWTTSAGCSARSA